MMTKMYTAIIFLCHTVQHVHFFKVNMQIKVTASPNVFIECFIIMIQKYYNKYNPNI